VQQYFHKGLLWRASETLEMACYELFTDLFYVGIIAIAGDGAAHEATGQAPLQYCMMFILGWKYWSDVSVFVSWFDTDDIIRWLSVLFGLVCLVGLTTNMTASWEDTYVPLISFYIAGRWFISLYYIWMAYLIPIVRASMLLTAPTNWLPDFLWIGSIYIPNPWTRQSFKWPAIAFDLCGKMLTITLQRGPSFLSSRAHQWAKSKFGIYPPSNIKHKIKCTGVFVTLVFGSSVLALLYQSGFAFSLNAFFGKATLGLIQVFAFNWLYFEIDQLNLHAHAIRRHVASALLWLTPHLPFVLSFSLAGSAYLVP